MFFTKYANGCRQAPIGGPASGSGFVENHEAIDLEYTVSNHNEVQNHVSGNRDSFRVRIVPLSTRNSPLGSSGDLESPQGIFHVAPYPASEHPMMGPLSKSPEHRSRLLKAVHHPALSSSCISIQTMQIILEHEHMPQAQGIRMPCNQHLAGSMYLCMRVYLCIYRICYPLPKNPRFLCFEWPVQYQQFYLLN